MNILGFKIQLYPEKKKKVKIEKFTKGYPKSRKKERSRITSKKENRDNY